MDRKQPQWCRSLGFDKSVPVDNFTYPRRTYLAGKGGLSFLQFNHENEMVNTCVFPHKGFKVLLHAPDEAPNFDRHSQDIYVPVDKTVMVSVTPQLTTTSDGLRDYHPLRRQCFYDNERPLRLFKAYTQSNCELECLANITLQQCGCVKFSMPRELIEHANSDLISTKILAMFFLCSLPGDNGTPVCDSRQIACYDRVAIDWRKPSQFDDGSSLISPCNCLPGCTDISYVADVHHTHFFDLTKEHLL